jgi:hypothetical protein
MLRVLIQKALACRDQERRGREKKVQIEVWRD